MNPNQQILDELRALRSRVDQIEATRGKVNTGLDPDSERYAQRSSAKWLESDYGILPLPDIRGT